MAIRSRLLKAEIERVEGEVHDARFALLDLRQRIGKKRFNKKEAIELADEIEEALRRARDILRGSENPLVL